MGTRDLTEIINKNEDYPQKRGCSEAQFCALVEGSLHSQDYEWSARYHDISLKEYKDFNALDPRVLAEILEVIAAPDEKQAGYNRRQFNDRVAPEDLIVGDFNQTSTFLMDGYENLNKEDLDLMAILGHAQNGHGAFRGHGKYVNTTFANVMEALRGKTRKLSNIELYSFPNRCQEEIDEFVGVMLLSFFEGGHPKPNKKLLDLEGKPLGRLNFLNGFSAYPLSLLAGWVFTGNMDTEEVRKEVEEKYSHPMGRGETYAVSRERLAHLGINLDELARQDYKIGFLNHLEHSKLISLFRDTGVIVSRPVEAVDQRMTWREAKETYGIDTAAEERDIIQAYIRSAKGKGVADDIAVFLSAYLLPSNKNVYAIREGKLHPYYENNPSELMSQLLGGAGADRVDTKEKYSYLVVEGGQDNLSSRLAQAKFAEACKEISFRAHYDIPARKDGKYVILDRDTIIDFTLASAKMRHDIHSSTRYFLKAHEIEQEIRGKIRRGELTCTSNEIFRLAADIAQYLQIPCHPIYKGNSDVPENMTVGFNKIPLTTVLDEMKERLGTVIDPERRQERLRNMVERHKKYSGKGL